MGKVMRKILDIPDKIDTERFFKFVTTDKCWNWNGSLTAGGYGKFYNSGKLYLAHRVSFKIKNGFISNELQIDHICKNRKCVNPDHLRQVTAKINTTENSNSVSAINKAKTHCINGHEFTKENTRLRKNGKECIICERKRCNKSAKKYREIRRLNRPKPVSCKKGHPLEDVRDKISGFRYRCYQCRLERNRRYYAKKSGKLQS